MRVPDAKAYSEERAAEWARYAQEQEDATGRALAKKLARDGKAVAGESCADWFSRLHSWKESKGLVTVRDMRGRVKNWITPILGPKPVRSVTRADLEGVVRRLDEEIAKRTRWYEEHDEDDDEPAPGLSWKSAQNIWGEVTSAFDEACSSKNPELRAREDNPAANVRGPDRGIERSKPVLYPSEAAALLACEDVPIYWRRTYAVALYTAARLNELAALAPDDVDVEHQRLAITKQLDRRTRKVRPTKTRRARTIDIEPELLPLLVLLAREAKDQGRERLLRMPPDEDRASLFRKHLAAAGCTRPELFADDAMRAPIRFHQTRDTCLTWMAVRGDDPLRIQWRGGHTDFKTTQVYIGQGRNLSRAFGAPFAPLPPSLLGAPLPAGTATRAATNDDGPAQLPEAIVISSRPQRELNPCYRRERPVS